MSKKIRRLIVLAIISASMAFATGCGAGSAGKDTGKEAASTVENGGNAAKDNVVNNKEDGSSDGATAESTVADTGSTGATKSENLDSLLGEWVKIASMGEDYYSSAVDIESEGTLDIYVEDGYYKVDYVENENVYGEYYGIKIYEVEKPDYPGNDAAPWYAQFTRRKAPNVVHDIALLDKDVIKLHIHYSYTYEEEETGETIEDIYDNYEVYVRKDSADIDDIILKYRYNNTVNVSNIRELYEAISDNTRIILEAGTYNISQLPFEQRHNDKINYVYNDETWEPVFYDRDTICVTSVNNLSIEVKEGASVTICTEDAYEAPLYFDSCNNVTLSGLTLGHQVEPGTCSGAVVLLDDTNVVNIENCRLYGCGTYGIEANYSHNINVNDTEIYECTYGLVRLFHTDNVTFRDCNMHDSNPSAKEESTSGSETDEQNVSESAQETLFSPKPAGKDSDLRIEYENGAILARRPNFTESGGIVTMQFNAIDWYCVRVIRIEDAMKYFPDDKMLTQSSNLKVFQSYENQEFEYSCVFVPYDGSNFVFLFETDISPEAMDFGFGFNDSIHYYAGDEEVFPNLELDRSVFENTGM